MFRGERVRKNAAIFCRSQRISGQALDIVFSSSSLKASGGEACAQKTLGMPEAGQQRRLDRYCVLLSELLLHLARCERVELASQHFYPQLFGTIIPTNERLRTEDVN